MFKKIVFAVNSSPACGAAAKIAFELAKKFESELTLVHVIDAATNGNAGFIAGGAQSEKEGAGADDVKWIKARIKKTHDTLVKRYGAPKIEILTGSPAARILDHAATTGADCIIMGAHDRTFDPSAERFRGIVGVTMQTVARKAECPVMIVSRPCETCFWYFNRIVFGTDFSKASMAAFRFAYKMARHIGGKLFLFHALNIESTQAGVGPGQKSIETRITEAEKRIEDLYVSQMEDFDNYDVAVWEGVPYVELLKFTRERQGDLIVTTRRTRDADDAVLGSTFEQVVLRSGCPVTSVNMPDLI